MALRLRLRSVRSSRRGQQLFEAIKALSTKEFKQQYQDISAIKKLLPTPGFINKAAMVVCTNKLNVFEVEKKWDKKTSGVWMNVGAVVNTKEDDLPLTNLCMAQAVGGSTCWITSRR